MSTTLDDLCALAIGPVRDGVRAAMLRAAFDAGQGRTTDERTEHAVVDAIIALYRFKVTSSPTPAEIDAKREELCAPLFKSEREVVKFFAKQSRWLAGERPPKPPEGLRPALERRIVAAEADAALLVAALDDLRTMPGLYDYEIATAVIQLLDSALERADRSLTRLAIASAFLACTRIRKHAHVMRSVTALAKASAWLRDDRLVEKATPCSSMRLPT